MIPPLLIRFQQEYPNIAIRLVGEINTNLSALLENGEIDLAIAPCLWCRPQSRRRTFIRRSMSWWYLRRF